MEYLDIRGEATLTIKRAGKPPEVRHHKNLVTTVGKTLAAQRIAGVAANAITHMAIGADNQSPALADTALIGTEHERVAVTPTVSGNEITIIATFGAGIGSDVVVGEFGVFNATSAGTMFSRLVTPLFDLDSTDTVDVIWKLYLGGNPP